MDFWFVGFLPFFPGGVGGGSSTSRPQCGPHCALRFSFSFFYNFFFRPFCLRVPLPVFLSVSQLLFGSCWLLFFPSCQHLGCLCLLFLSFSWLFLLFFFGLVFIFFCAVLRFRRCLSLGIYMPCAPSYFFSTLLCGQISLCTCDFHIDVGVAKYFHPFYYVLNIIYCMQMRLNSQQSPEKKEVKNVE